MYYAPPLTGLPSELDIGAMIKKNKNDGATRKCKKFYYGFSRLDKYRHVTDNKTSLDI